MMDMEVVSHGGKKGLLFIIKWCIIVSNITLYNLACMFARHIYNQTIYLE